MTDDDALDRIKAFMEMRPDPGSIMDRQTNKAFESLRASLKQHEKERAFITAYAQYDQRPNYDNECKVEDAWRALTERAKP